MAPDEERLAKLERVEGEARSLGYQLTSSEELAALRNAPIEIRLHCPECGELHIDEGEFATKPHHTHSCQACGMTWRPAVRCTVGVQFLPGFKNAR